MPNIQARTTLTLAFNAGATPQAASVMWPGGPGTFSAEASWGGGSATLQTQTANGTWVAVGPDTTLTANGIAGFILPKGAELRVLIVTSTVVYAYVTPFTDMGY